MSKLRRSAKPRLYKRSAPQRIGLDRLNDLKRAGVLPLKLRGRRFTYRGLRTIILCVLDNFSKGRTRISELVCQRLKWRQPNGWLKDRAYRDVLRRLEKMHLFHLPSIHTKRACPSTAKTTSNAILGDALPQVCKMPQSIDFELAKGNKSEAIWNFLVSKYHYLGHKVQVGRCLKYLVRGDGQLLAAISFSSPAWKLAGRDELLRAIGFEEVNIRESIINNSRFLILPSVQVPHLASRILAAATRRVFTDWSWYYSIEPQLAETFVEPTRFEGTCYRAANWIEIGKTQGYAKVGASHHNSQQPKKLFVYGLTREIRRKLSQIAEQHFMRSGHEQSRNIAPS